MTSFSEISPAQLLRRIGTPGAPALIDLRTPEDFADDPWTLPAAERHDWRDLSSLTSRADMVIICHRGLKISQGAAALLRTRGVTAQALTGGQIAWRAAGYPLIDHSKRAASHLWVTRHRPKIDRVACPWLVRRFIDTNSAFLYVAPSQVDAVADRFNAEPFDTPGARFTDRDGGSSFDALLRVFGLDHTPLNAMAEVIRAADTGVLSDAPQAAGVSAILLGLSRMYRDDLAQLEAALPVMDSLYRWARDAQDERHREQT